MSTSTAPSTPSPAVFGTTAPVPASTPAVAPALPNPPEPLSPTGSYNFVAGDAMLDVSLASAQLAVRILASKGFPGATIYALALSTSSSEDMPLIPEIPQSEFAAYKVPELALLMLKVPGQANYAEVGTLLWMFKWGYPQALWFE